MRPNTTYIGKRTTLLVALALLSGCLSSEQKGNFAGDSKADDSDSGATNNTPVISGSPSVAVLVGEVYSFTPSASDADGDALTFSIRNKPRWASFDASTGRLSGQVLLGDVGVYEQIRISVSDGTATVSLRDFSVTVSQTALGSMTLSWTPPTENEDGTALTNLAGYNIYFGTSQGIYPNSVRINNPSISTYVIESLVPDTYYLVATSFNAQGVESTYSNVAVKTVSSN